MGLIKMNQYMLWHQRKKKPYRLKVNRVWTDEVIHLCLIMVVVRAKKKSPLLCQHTGDPHCLSTSYTYRVLCLQLPLFRLGLTVLPYKTFAIKDQRKIGTYIGKGRVKAICSLRRRERPIAFCGMSDSAGGCA